jgi:hypothetical protein
VRQLPKIFAKCLFIVAGDIVLFTMATSAQTCSGAMGVCQTYTQASFGSTSVNYGDPVTVSIYAYYYPTSGGPTAANGASLTCSYSASGGGVAPSNVTTTTDSSGNASFSTPSNLAVGQYVVTCSTTGPFPYYDTSPLLDDSPTPSPLTVNPSGGCAATDATWEVTNDDPYSIEWDFILDPVVPSSFEYPPSDESGHGTEDGLVAYDCDNDPVFSDYNDPTYVYNGYEPGYDGGGHDLGSWTITSWEYQNGPPCDYGNCSNYYGGSTTPSYQDVTYILICP